jgi:hypothetical protein
MSILSLNNDESAVTFMNEQNDIISPLSSVFVDPENYSGVSNN